MQQIEGRWIFATSDLTDALGCAHLTTLERAAVLGTIAKPPLDDAAALIARKGMEHERAHLTRLAERYGHEQIALLSPRAESTIAALEEAEHATLEAMQRGTSIIYQAGFFDGTFVGRADFLRRINRPSAHWNWSYEAVDTKLAVSAKPQAIVQLSAYSEHLTRLQGTTPEFMHVVLGSGLERHYRVRDYDAYYRHTKATFLERFDADAATYPFECTSCLQCRWSRLCERRREADDHLSLVANIRRDQIAKFETANITTVRTLTVSQERPRGLAENTFERLRAQARLQWRQREAFAANAQARYFYELLDSQERQGFAALPQPDDGDVFFDMEGDPLYAPDHGLEYLFGIYLPHENRYRSFFARADTEERGAFERFVDFVAQQHRLYPRMHVYHYAPYETIALRRLMGRYGSREDEIDELLRNEVFVDLYAIARQALRISQPSYSLKRFEAFYGMERATDVRRGDDSIVQFETWLLTHDDAILNDIERYNEDDCRSTYGLRMWLLERKAEFERERGIAIPWKSPPQPKEEPAAEHRTLVARLLDGISPPLSLSELREIPDDRRARFLLGELLEYYRRENKPAWWRMFDRYENLDALEEFDHEALAGLQLRGDIVPYLLKPTDRTQVYTYDFPEQQHKMRSGDQPYCPERREPAGVIVSIDDGPRLIAIKLRGAIDPHQLRALIPGAPRPHDAQQAALCRIAEAYLDTTLERNHRAAFDILLARPPRLTNRATRIQPATMHAEEISRIVADLDESALFIQGPPGSGKSTKAAVVIANLLARKKRVGILANSHKAIHNLLHKVESVAQERGLHFAGLQKFSDEEDAYRSAIPEPLITAEKEAKQFARQVHDLAAGTSWLFARDDLISAYDYLFIDEAGQVSLADALACAPAAHNVVLLGDPLQLAAVSQGAHPVGTDLSVLEHLLADAPTISPDRGIFLDESYRMHPAICAFISKHVYNGRLKAAAGTENFRIDSPGLSGSGLRFHAVEHAGNRRASPEEADHIIGEIGLLLQGTHTSHDGHPLPITQHDVLVVSPYNAQCSMLRARIDAAGLSGVRVGTVDKFQGQEAPVVFYSMATSSGDELPRALEFLFERNRFNVAISRAQCMSILVCSPHLLDVPCNSVEQMALVNLLCAFMESANALL